MARQKKKIEDLARVRTNQRNCRERRQKYIAELEQKVKYYEGAQCRTRPQDNTQNLGEDEVLKALFDPSSVSENHRDQTPKDRLKHPDPEWDGTATRTQTSCPTNFEYREFPGQVNAQVQSLGMEAPPMFTHISNQAPLLAHSSGTELNQFSAPSQAFPGFVARLNGTRLNAPTYFPTSPWFYDPFDTGAETLICDRAQPESPPKLWPVLTDETAREDRSMLCSVAYRLISQLNNRQYDDMEIDIRIRSGFRLGRTQSEDCRVDIGALLAVLAEIS